MVIPGAFHAHRARSGRAVSEFQLLGIGIAHFQHPVSEPQRRAALGRFQGSLGAFKQSGSWADGSCGEIVVWKSGQQNTARVGRKGKGGDDF